jgi:hypothetical protein
LEVTARNPSEVRELLKLSEELPSERLGALVGIGYAPDITRGWVPLIVLDAQTIGVSPAPEPMPILWRAVPPPVREVLAQDDFPEAMMLPVAPPELLSEIEPGQMIRGSSTRLAATAGVRAVRRIGEDLWQKGFLTAGHTFPAGAGSEVYRVPDGFVGRYLTSMFGVKEGLKIGTVTLHESPLPPRLGGEYDYAFVDLALEDGRDWDPRLFRSQLPPAPDFETAREVLVKTDATDRGLKGSLIGAMMKLECWRDSWIFGPTDIVRKGHSGSAVTLDPEDESIGVLVGRSAVAEHAHHVYVQSLQRLLAERLRDWEVLVEQFPNGGSG